MSGSVLIIEDEPEVRQVTARMLMKAGFEVIDAANGHDAIALLEGGLQPSVIVLDLWMPVMDGWEFLERARPTAPVVVISGVAEQVSPLPRCVVKLLLKPIAFEPLVAAIRAAQKT